ncbi:D-arabinono-1,4-lactone oxidase [Frigoribacterium sp. 2-23]|uniref:D-arabinono-1,4-lactone oxidase n=1 Tax=Frigoribacterium sp. 2-23 TaxID=3415006 RepID=UPI003C702865
MSDPLAALPPETTDPERPGDDAGSNWSSTYSYGAAWLVEATSIDEVKEAVAGSDRVRALGTRHSFNDIADSTGTLVTVTSIDPDPVLDVAADGRSATVTVGAGTRYGVVATFLETNGWALHNMGSLPHISVAGAISTGTHGSGHGNGALATAVRALDVVGPTGELVRYERGDADFDGALVALGTLGVVVRVTLDVQPSYRMRQDVYTGLSWDALLSDVDLVTGLAYSVSVFGHWGEDGLRVWAKSRVPEGADTIEMPETVLDAILDPTSTQTLAPGVEGNLTEQGGAVSAWLHRLPHFRLDSTPSNGDEIQSEFSVDRRDGAAALAAVRALADRIDPLLVVTELRTAAADGLWLSEFYERDALLLHFTWKNEPDAVLEAVREVQRALAPFAARPHWGKVFDEELVDFDALYPRIADARALARRVDPDGTFHNSYLDRTLFQGDAR